MIALGRRTKSKQYLLKTTFRVATLVALIYIFLAIAKQWEDISEWRPDLLTVFVLVGLIAIYGASLFLLAEMWHRLIQVVSGKSLSRNLTLPSYTETQIVKYLPGNVFHLIGRHTFLSSHGFEHRQLARAFVLEVVCLIFGASIVAATGFLLVGDGIGGNPLMILGMLGLLLLTFVSVFAFTKLTGSRITPFKIDIIAIALSLMFFACQGLIFYTICRLISPSADLFAVPSTALSWIAGYVVPGAPGGLGIREFVQLTLSNLGLRAPEALIAITLFRGVTILGDIMCFITGRMILK